MTQSLSALRQREVVSLKVGDINSLRMKLRVEQGKLLDGGWLFPRLNRIESLGTCQLNRAIHAAAELARILTAIMRVLRQYSSGTIVASRLGAVVFIHRFGS